MMIHHKKTTMHTWHCILLGLWMSAICSVRTEDQSDPQFTLQKCCPSGYGILSNQSCVPFDTGPLELPFYVDGEELVEREVFLNGTWGLTCDEDHVLNYLNLDDGLQIHVYDQIHVLYWLSPDTNNWELVQQFCVDVAADGGTLDGKPQYSVEFCYKDPVLQWKEDAIACENTLCVRKCCPEGQIYNSSCQIPHVDVTWEPTLHSEDDNSVVVAPSNLLIVHGVPECPVSLIYDDYTLLETGKIALPGYPLDILPSQYCLDAFAEGEKVAEKLVLCHIGEEEGASCWWRQFIVDTLFMSVSCVFMAITWIIYVSITELRANTQGRCIISFVTAIFVAFVTILVNRNHRETFPSFACSFIAVLSNMSILATFFWLNVLSYHIWDCLRSGRNREEKRVFLAYSIYGWGCPLLVALVGVILDATEADVVRPDFRPPHCWFKDRTTKWVYQYGFMLALLIVNLTFFLSSAVMVTKRLRQTQDMRHHSDGLWLFLKLFIIMGITWLIEMLTWLLEEDPCVTWVAVLDAINALHGVYIFLVTVCFRRDYRIFRLCCGTTTKYDMDGTAVSCTRDNFMELLDDQSK